MRYLAYPVNGQKRELIEDIKTIPGCHVQMLLNQEAILVTIFTESEIQEEFTRKQLANLDSLMWLIEYKNENVEVSGDVVSNLIA